MTYSSLKCKFYSTSVIRTCSWSCICCPVVFFCDHNCHNRSLCLCLSPQEGVLENLSRVLHQTTSAEGHVGGDLSQEFCTAALQSSTDGNCQCGWLQIHTAHHVNHEHLPKQRQWSTPKLLSYSWVNGARDDSTQFITNCSHPPLPLMATWGSWQWLRIVLWRTRFQ